MYKIILPLAIFLLSSCVEFKSEYPETNYYTLSQPKNDKNYPEIDAAILIKHIRLASWINLDYLSLYKNDNQIERYYYHKWQSDLNSQINQYLRNCIIDSKSFSGGVADYSSFNSANFTLEIEVLDLKSTLKDDIIITQIDVNYKIYEYKNSKYIQIKNEKISLSTDLLSGDKSEYTNDDVAQIPQQISKLLLELNNLILKEF